MKIRGFRPEDFDQLVDCYRIGFPKGHNRYSLSRLVRYQRDTVMVAEDQRKVIGVIIGITSYREAWLTGLSVLPSSEPNQHRCSMHLLQSLGNRLLALGFDHAFATTQRRSINSLARIVKAELVSVDKSFYFDGQTRWVYRADMSDLRRLTRLLPTF